MPKAIYSFFFSILFTVSLFSQQYIQADWSYTKGKDHPGTAFSLSWFTPDGLLSGSVLRLNYFNTRNDYYYDPIHIFQMDVAKRWSTSQDRRVSVHFEAGLSGMVTNTKAIYYNNEYYDSWRICDDCLPYTYEPKYDSKNKTSFFYEVEGEPYLMAFLPGINLGLGLDVLVIKQFYMGIHSRANLYYNLNKTELVTYLHNGLHAGFRF